MPTPTEQIKLLEQEIDDEFGLRTAFPEVDKEIKQLDIPFEDLITIKADGSSKIIDSLKTGIIKFFEASPTGKDLLVKLLSAGPITVNFKKEIPHEGAWFPKSREIHLNLKCKLTFLAVGMEHLALAFLQEMNCIRGLEAIVFEFCNAVNPYLLTTATVANNPLMTSSSEKFGLYIEFCEYQTFVHAIKLMSGFFGNLNEPNFDQTYTHSTTVIDPLNGHRHVDSYELKFMQEKEKLNLVIEAVKCFIMGLLMAENESQCNSFWEDLKKINNVLHPKSNGLMPSIPHDASLEYSKEFIENCFVLIRKKVCKAVRDEYMFDDLQNIYWWAAWHKLENVFGIGKETEPQQEEASHPITHSYDSQRRPLSNKVSPTELDSLSDKVRISCILV